MTTALFTSVALLHDVPRDDNALPAHHGLVKGSLGAVVEQLDEHNYIVEFVNHDGSAYAILDLNENEFMVLVDRFPP